MARSSSSRSRTGKKKQQFLPEAVSKFLARRIWNMWSLAILGAGVFLLVAFLSYSAKDPSFNTAANAGAVDNWAGIYGAYAADIFIQTLGMAAYFLPVVILLWGVRFLKKKPFERFNLRLSALLFLMVSGAFFMAQIPAYDGWEAGSYLGGSVGILSLNFVSGLLTPIVGRFTPYFLMVAGFLIVAACFGYASHVSFAGWKRMFRAIARGIFWCGDKILSGIYGFIAWVRHYSYDDDEIEHKEKFSLVSWFETHFKADPSDASDIGDERPLRSVKQERMPEAETGGAIDKIMAKQGSFLEKAEDETSDVDVIEPSASKAAQRIAVSVPAKIDANATTPRKSYENWELPPLDLLQPAQASDNAMSEDEIQEQAARLQEVLMDFGVKGDIVKVHPGPVVTLYELEPAPGTKSSRVISLSEDIARSMEAISVRAAVIPGKNAIGIEIPNPEKETVYLRELLSTKDYTNTKCKIPLVLGKDIGGHPVIADLGKMPHLLVAGTTGSGKSVAVNTMILSLLYCLPPEKCRFIMVDPKMLELSIYDGIPHLLSPVVTEPGKAVVALKWAVREMEERYRAMSKLGVRNIDGYNIRIKQAIEKSEVITKKVQTGWDADTGKPVFEEQQLELKELPYIVIIVDEFADLMMVAGKDVEAAIQRLAQMARAAGIHLIMATQRPSVDVITGTVKANFPTRISFQVTSKIDSRTILGEGGAESLLGQGDMLYMAAGGRITRVHGPFASDGEVEKVVRYCKSQGEPDYVEDVTEDSSGGDILGLFDDGDGKGEYDELYDEAVAIVAREQKASTSYLQRQLQIGYNRAARIIEQMEKDGVVSAANHVGKRDILIGER